MNNTSVGKVGYLSSRNIEMTIFLFLYLKTGRLKRDTLNQEVGWQGQFTDKSAADFLF